MDIAVVGVGAAVELDESRQTILAARVGLGAVAPTPLLATAVNELLAGQRVSDELLSRASHVARQAISPITDMRGTAEYRVHVTGVLVERVLRTAIARARGEQVIVKAGH
jgi:carbon-monoxide dehydrogenase medium subunit